MTGRRRALMPEKGIPGAYTQLEYIECKKFGYLIAATDTSVLRLSKWTLDCHIDISQGVGINGSYYAPLSDTRISIGYSGANQKFYLCNGPTDVVNKSDNARHTFVIDFVNHQGFIDDISYNLLTGTPPQDYSLDLAIGARMTTNGADYNICEKVYYSKVEMRNGKIIELIPCQRNYDGKYGMYDIVGRKFHIGIGTWSGGSAV